MVKIPDISSKIWFNTHPLSLRNLKGKVVLIEFWTYSCVNCLRTLPYLKKWWEQYKDKGFVLIGVHTPEFEFEKDPKNVQWAIQKYGIGWPVILDSERTIWKSFANHYWPAEYLADKEGLIVYKHFGEGGYQKTERLIQNLIDDLSIEIETPDIGPPELKFNGRCFVPTPETYCGYKRGDIANPYGYRAEKIFNYRLPNVLRVNHMALEGKFLTKPDYIESKGTNATIFIRFIGTEVNLVLEPAENKKTIVKLEFNDEILAPEIKGVGVTEGGQLAIIQPSMYNLIKNRTLLEGILAVKALEGNFRAYVFTFSGCQEPIERG